MVDQPVGAEESASCMGVVGVLRGRRDASSSSSSSAAAVRGRRSRVDSSGRSSCSSDRRCLLWLAFRDVRPQGFVWRLPARPSSGAVPAPGRRPRSPRRPRRRIPSACDRGSRSAPAAQLIFGLAQRLAGFGRLRLSSSAARSRSNSDFTECHCARALLTHKPGEARGLRQFFGAEHDQRDDRDDQNLAEADVEHRRGTGGSARRIVTLLLLAALALALVLLFASWRRAGARRACLRRSCLS